jgi:hypothetical protein
MHESGIEPARTSVRRSRRSARATIAVIEPGLANIRDDNPVAAQVDGIVKSLIDCGDFSPGEWPVERVFWSLALERRDVPLAFG